MYPQFNFQNSMPTATQPYGYSMPNYNQPPQVQPQLPQNTNIIFVSGLDDAKSRWQAPNTEMFYADNDKPLLYKKKVNANGQFDIKVFEIKEQQQTEETKQEKTMDLSGFVKTTDLDEIKGEIKSLKEQVSKYNRLGEIINGTKSNTNS